MVKKKISLFLLIAVTIILIQPSLAHETQASDRLQTAPDNYDEIKALLSKSYGSRISQQWSEIVPGVETRLDTDDKVIALTLDACGSKDDGYDAQLIDFLIKENISATLFINARWIDKNPEAFRRLSQNPLFEIGNHGLEHKPCSVNGKSQYGLSGTNSVAEVIDEVELNASKIQKLTGHKPRYYRSGTAYYDEVAVEVVQSLGYTVAGFSVLGDAGASYSKDKVRMALLGAGAGDIIICHMNHPEKETAEGVILAIPELKRRGFRFVKLSAHGLH